MGKAKIIENTYLKVYKKLTILYCQFQYQNWPEKIKQTMREIQKLEKCYSGEKKKGSGKKRWEREKASLVGSSKWLRNNYLYYCWRIQDGKFANCFKDRI